MNVDEFRASVSDSSPRAGLSVPLTALWWDAKGDWSRAHELVNDLETEDGMAVHAYLHRKEGSTSNAEHWYQRAGRGFQRESFQDEWEALVKGLLRGGKQ